MYGFDGNMSALQFAEQFGFTAVQPADQAELIKHGFYTSDGVRTDKESDTTSSGEEIGHA